MARLGIIAGGGGLPAKLVEACRRDSRPFFVLALDKHADDSIVSGVPHARVRLGDTARSIGILKENGVTDLVMAGSVRKPALSELRPDWRSIQILARLGKAAFGDDKLLRVIAEELEKDGFRIVGAHEVEPALITPAGLLGRHVPSEGLQKDIELGIRVTKELGRLDVGQAAVVQQGIVLGVEAIEGTDELLARCRKLRRRGAGGVLVKSCKPQQDKRLDLPSIGLRTVKNAFEAGLSGIAVEAGASFMLDRDETVTAADKLGLFITGFTA